ncbi:T9SS type A sorting domain-containing protein [bacterium]|nr:T9SS type A sorting domain-containing protein [bacterium]
MRKIVIILFILVIYMSSYHAETMYINLISGETITFNTTEINQITFSDDTSIDDMVELIGQLPIKFLKNYPNPFNPTTTISFQIDEKGETVVEVYNVKGQKVNTLSKGHREPGNHTIVWDGRSTNGKPVASGLYFYKVSINGHNKTKKMLLIK